MEIAALIVSVLALIASLGCLVIMLAKNYFSTHVVQMQPVGGGDLMGEFSREIGKVIGNPFREIDDPIDDQEREHLELLKQKRHSTKHTPKPT